jgi:hypothetical protein
MNRDDYAAVIFPLRLDAKLLKEKKLCNNCYRELYIIIDRIDKLSKILVDDFH